MKTQEIAALLEARDWTFAKSMADTPHWYTKRWQWRRDADFVAVLDFIQARGVKMLYGKSKYQVLVLNGFLYWACVGYKPPAPFARWDKVIINRRPLTPEEAATLPPGPQPDLYQ